MPQAIISRKYINEASGRGPVILGNGLKYTVRTLLQKSNDILVVSKKSCIFAAKSELIMNNADFWTSVHTIIAEGFTSEGLQKLDSYAEQFISGRLVYQRFSPQEQHGCATGGATNVIASLLAGAETGSDSQDSSTLSDYQRECKLGAQQEGVIERWAKAVGV
jgi:hypothetical protein